MAEHVFILGAGFSADAGGPLQREMLDVNAPKNRKAIGHLVTAPEFGTLQKLLRTLPDDEKTIEGLMNALDSGRLYGDTFGRYAPDTLMEFLLDYVVTLIGARVGDPTEFDVYNHFSKRFLNKKGVSLVSFNYDFVSEILLLGRHGGFHYGFPHDEDRFRYMGLRGARGGPLLLKLHGSMSWGRCGSCHKVWLHDRVIPVSRGRLCPRSPDCNGRLRMLIVPPMWNKESAASQVSLLWSRALEELSEAQRATIVGFSFPPLDRAAADLVRAALRKNPRLELQAFNGAGFDYEGLGSRLGCKIKTDRGKLRDLVGP